MTLRKRVLLGLILVCRCESEAADFICKALKTLSQEPLSFQVGKITPLCVPFLSKPERKMLDRCSEAPDDPYASFSSWASPQEMKRRGYVHLLRTPQGVSLQKQLLERAQEIKTEVSTYCCGTDRECENAMLATPVTVCDSKAKDSESDRCVFGGYFQFTADNYKSFFKALAERSSSDGSESYEGRIRRNLSQADYESAKLSGSQSKKSHSSATIPGRIVLSSYVSLREGISSLEPILRHELGHACSMIKMQLSAQRRNSREVSERALKALDETRDSCDSHTPSPSFYSDFWQSLGESPEFSGCLQQLAELNQKQQIDRPCPRVCARKLLEESVGIAFSLLTGGLDGEANSSFPNTCNHVRDQQHPMVADVVECLSRYSKKFKSRLSQTFGCQVQISGN